MNTHSNVYTYNLDCMGCVQRIMQLEKYNFFLEHTIYDKGVPKFIDWWQTQNEAGKKSGTELNSLL